MRFFFLLFSFAQIASLMSATAIEDTAAEELTTLSIEAKMKELRRLSIYPRLRKLAIDTATESLSRLSFPEKPKRSLKKLSASENDQFSENLCTFLSKKETIEADLRDLYESKNKPSEEMSYLMLKDLLLVAKYSKKYPLKPKEETIDKRSPHIMSALASISFLDIKHPKSAETKKVAKPQDIGKENAKLAENFLLKRQRIQDKKLEESLKELMSFSAENPAESVKFAEFSFSTHIGESAGQQGDAPIDIISNDNLFEDYTSIGVLRATQNRASFIIEQTSGTYGATLVAHLWKPAEKGSSTLATFSYTEDVDGYFLYTTTAKIIKKVEGTSRSLLFDVEGTLCTVQLALRDKEDPSPESHITLDASSNTVFRPEEDLASQTYAIKASIPLSAHPLTIQVSPLIHTIFLQYGKKSHEQLCLAPNAQLTAAVPQLHTIFLQYGKKSHEQLCLAPNAQLTAAVPQPLYFSHILECHKPALTFSLYRSPLRAHINAWNSPLHLLPLPNPAPSTSAIVSSHYDGDSALHITAYKQNNNIGTRLTIRKGGSYQSMSITAPSRLTWECSKNLLAQCVYTVSSHGKEVAQQTILIKGSAFIAPGQKSYKIVVESDHTYSLDGFTIGKHDEKIATRAHTTTSTLLHYPLKKIAKTNASGCRVTRKGEAINVMATPIGLVVTDKTYCNAFLVTYDPQEETFKDKTIKNKTPFFPKDLLY